MGLSTKLQLARLVAHLLAPGGDPGSPDPHLREEPAVSASGARYALYRPRGPARGAVVIGHAGDREGWRNARVVRFARALARSQVACALPELAGVARCAYDPADVAALEEICLELAGRTDRRPGMVGFAYGGGYALAAAARPALAGTLRFVVGVGAFHDLGALLDGYAARAGIEPANAFEWDDAVYLRLVLAWWFRDALGLGEPLRREIDAFIDRFCHRASPEEKRAFYERHLRALDVFGVAARAADRASLAALSPAGRGHLVRCPVTLIHDRFDGLVPLQDAERLRDEIPGARLVVTEVLAHATPARALDLVALARLTSALEPLVAES